MDRAKSGILSLVAAWLVVSLAVASGFADDPPAQEQTIKRLYPELDRLFRRYYPNVESRVAGDAIHFAYKTRVFLVHEPLKTGEWQDAREIEGPDRGGILCDIESRKGPYAGAAVVPQTFDKRYFKLLVMAPYSSGHDEHLYVHLYFPADASDDFLHEFGKLVSGVWTSPAKRSLE